MNIYLYMYIHIHTPRASPSNAFRCCGTCATLFAEKRTT